MNGTDLRNNQFPYNYSCNSAFFILSAVCRMTNMKRCRIDDIFRLEGSDCGKFRLMSIYCGSGGDGRYRWRENLIFREGPQKAILVVFVCKN